MTAPSAPFPAANQAPAPSWRNRLAVSFLRAALVFGLVAIVPAIIDAYGQREWGQIVVYCGVYLTALAITIAPVPYRLRAGVTVGLIYSLGIAALFENALQGAASIYLVAFTMLALLLFNFRISLLSFAISLLSIVAVSLLMIYGWVSPDDADAVRPTWLALVDASTTFGLLTIPIIVGINLLQREFTTTQERERAAIAELERERGQLEERVADRARTVERRTIQIAIGAEIARAAGAQLEPVRLLDEVVSLILARFELYYVGAFLVDEQRQFAVLQAGTGQAGEAMLANQHQLEIGGQSMIGQAVSLGQARIALDAGQEAVRFNNPYLPLTRSEMALPLTARNRTIGALTIQSGQPAAFTPDDIVSLQGMADLIAIALDNARLFQEAQRALQEVTDLHRNYIAQAWSAYSTAEGGLPTYVVDENSFSRGEPVTLPNIERAAAERQPVVGTSAEGSPVTVAIRLRDQVIGAIAIEGASPDRIWTPDELALIEAVLEQTALSLENARLLRETENALAESRRLADREQIVNAVSNKIRRLPSVESVLTTALVELGRVLGASRGLVRLGAPGRRPAQLEESHE